MVSPTPFQVGSPFYNINLLIIVVKMKSNTPKKIATATETPMTIKVYLKVSFRPGQLTFFISKWTSFRKVVIFVEIPRIFITN